MKIDTVDVELAITDANKHAPSWPPELGGKVKGEMVPKSLNNLSVWDAVMFEMASLYFSSSVHSLYLPIILL